MADERAPRHEAYLSLGSNLGDKAENLSRAREELAHRGIQILQASSLYQTEPVDYKDQDWFLNQVLQVSTFLEPEPLLDGCLQVETDLGRVRQVLRGPRLIDIDLLLYNHLSLNLPNLQIPHPRLHLRRFVLEPLAAIAPDVVHPILQKTVSALLEECLDMSKVVRLVA